MARRALIRERLRALVDAQQSLQQRLDERREQEVEVAGGELDSGSDEVVVSPPIRAGAEWAWRFLVIVAAAVVVAWVLWQLRLIVFPIIVALLLSALLYPLVKLLRRWHLPRALAAITVFVGGILVVVTIFTVLVTVLTDQLGDIADNARDGLDQVRTWLSTGPLHLSEDQITRYNNEISQWFKDHRQQLAGGALATASAALEGLAASLLGVFTLFFFLYDGERIWHWCTRLFPRHTEAAVQEAGRRAWRALVGYVRATLVIAATDALGIGILLAVIGVPLALPLGVLVFFGAFIPIVGAAVSGSVAVLVALVTNGFVAAVIVALGVIAIQQLEGHVLQPLIMGRFVRVHPLAIVLAVGIGGVVGGIGGTVIAVPFVAVVNVVTGYFASRYRDRVAGLPPGTTAPAVGGEAPTAEINGALATPGEAAVAGELRPTPE